MSRRNTLVRTRPPGSPRTRARVRSMGAPRLSSRSLRGHAALWSPRSSKWAWQERPLHLLAVASSGERS
eukprot:538065-Pyramimonas_sp.AAC.1